MHGANQSAAVVYLFVAHVPCARRVIRNGSQVVCRSSNLAWIVVTGEDVVFHSNALHMLRSVGHDVVATSEGSTALHLLGDVSHSMVVLLGERLGQMDVLEFLAAAAPDEGLRHRHGYILLQDELGDLPVEVERYRDELSIPLAPTPGDSADTGGDDGGFLWFLLGRITDGDLAGSHLLPLNGLDDYPVCHQENDCTGRLVLPRQVVPPGEWVEESAS